MNLIIVIAAAAVLFALAFLSKRRFGLLGLGLIAGATLASLWGYEAELLVSAVGLLPAGVPVDLVATAALVLLPALLLTLHGKKYKKVGRRVISGLLFAGLALTLLAEPLSAAFPLDASGVIIYTTLLQYQDLIVSAAIVLAILDLLFAKAPKPAPEEKHRH